MRTKIRQMLTVALLGGAMTLAYERALALGSDYPNGTPVRSTGHWPTGMEDLVNITNRVHGFFVNDGDVFFFSGSANSFTQFLQKYSEIQGTVEKHRLILHEGAGEAKSPWAKTGRLCDWQLSGRGNGWNAGVLTNYDLVVHFWTGGH